MYSPCLRIWRGSVGHARSVGTPSPPLPPPPRWRLHSFSQPPQSQHLLLRRPSFPGLCHQASLGRCTWQARYSPPGCPALSLQHRPGNLQVSGRLSWSLPCLPSRSLSRYPDPRLQKDSCPHAVVTGRSPSPALSAGPLLPSSPLSPCGGQVSPQLQHRWSLLRLFPGRAALPGTAL